MSDPRFLGLVVLLRDGFGLKGSTVRDMVINKTEAEVQAGLRRYEPVDDGLYVGLVVPLVAEVPIGRPCAFCEGGGRLYTWAFNPNPRSVEFPRASDLEQKARVCPECKGTGKERRP